MCKLLRVNLDRGARLGSFEIVEPVGAGAMGAVYKARDTRLDRFVAIKVLSGDLSSSPEARDRFEREARTISQLSRPHISALYDVGRTADVDYLVMELLDGETLSARLSRGAVPRVDARPVVGTDGARTVIWSPDERSIAFFAGDKLKRLDPPDGAPVTLSDVPDSRVNGTWGRDSILYTLLPGGIYRVPLGPYVAFASDESGRYEVYVAAFPYTGGKTRVSAAGGWLPRRSRDGRARHRAGGCEAQRGMAGLRSVPRRHEIPGDRARTGESAAADRSDTLFGGSRKEPGD